MHSHMNEDAMWERLKDMQREAENSRRWAEAHPLPLAAIRNWVEARLTWLVGRDEQPPANAEADPKTRVA